MRLITADAKIVRVPRFLGAFRVHAQQKTQSQIDSHGMQEMHRIRHRIHNRSVSNKECIDKLKPYFRHHLFHHYSWKAGLFRY